MIDATLAIPDKFRYNPVINSPAISIYQNAFYELDGLRHTLALRYMKNLPY